MIILIRKLLSAQQGATAVEYGLILALVVLGMMGGLSTLANKATSSLADTSNKVANN